MISKEDLALNDQQWLTCYKTKPNQTKQKPNFVNKYIFLLMQSSKF